MKSDNLIQVIFSILTLLNITVGCVITLFAKRVPFLEQLLKYGKIANRSQPTFIQKIEVPKSWFKHFYVYSLMFNSLMLCLMIAVYKFNFAVPQILLDILNVIGGDNREPNVPSSLVLLAMVLLTLQCYRRFYETQYVSVFSKRSRINLAHYTMGYIYYTSATMAILIEAPMFARNALSRSTVNWSDINYIHFGAVVLFLWSWWHQFKAAIILANLRKNNKGIVVTNEHKLPHGDWFKYVSSPHNLAEILMYIALTIILWNNTTWFYIFAVVLCNQVHSAIWTHSWYREHFADLPKERTALIPFIL